MNIAFSYIKYSLADNVDSIEAIIVNICVVTIPILFAVFLLFASLVVVDNLGLKRYVYSNVCYHIYCIVF